MPSNTADKPIQTPSFQQRLDAQRRSHLLLMASVAAFLMLIAAVANALAAIWPRAVPLVAGEIGLLLSIVWFWTRRSLELGARVAAAGVSLGLLAPIVFNGGLLDPRALLSVATFAIWNLLFLGVQRGRFIAISIAIVVVGTVIAERLGLLAMIQVRAVANANVELFVIASQLLAIILGVYLLSRQQQLMIELIQQEADGARRARDAESRFLSNMSHEIRNPLNGIKGVLEDLNTATNLNPGQKEDLGGAISAARSLGHIVDDVLEFKKIEDGSLKIQPESVDLYKFVADYSPTRKILAKQKGLELITEGVVGTPRYLFFDPVRVNQVLTNLFSNAVKFTHRGSITFSSYHKDGVANISVIDTGIGMSPETVANLFERFSQADDGTTKGFQGTGLGLAISKELVELMGGSISVESELGKGSTFTVRIPMPVDEERLHRDEKINQDSAPATSSADLAGMRVLCVDDSNINLKVVSRPLARAGASVTTASSGAEALALIEGNEFDVVVTDISMPEMDGEALFESVKARGLDMPFIALTGNVLAEDMTRYKANGFLAALGKPLDVVQLLDIVAKRVPRR